MRSVLVLAFAAALSTGALAQSDAAHHPPGASAPVGAASTAAQSKPRAGPKTTTAGRGQMDMQMKSMHEMHERMKAAKTPEEREALMTDHLKAMQGGMAMMGQMRGPDAKGGTSMSPEMMRSRMDMMEMMMEMMMDREAARTPAGK